MNLDQLASLFIKAGATKLYAKSLAGNDNSKNQVYFGPDFQALNLFPVEEIYADSSSKNPIFKAKLLFGWLQLNGAVVEAPGAQFILYPQYPEVRFSGFLQRCKAAPSELMASRIVGRILFLGITAKTIVGFVVDVASPIAAEFRLKHPTPTVGVFHEVGLPNVASGLDSRAKLLEQLRRINQLGWIDSKQLDSARRTKPCNAPQCGGFTLEAELGIAKNSHAEPDYFGWEVKQHTVTNFDRVEVGNITLMTPEPTGGFYKEKGVEAFIRKFGYLDKKGREDRWNFGGVHKVGLLHTSTKLMLSLDGYDARNERITDANGALCLVTGEGEVAASWAFSGILEHWSHKHAKAVYVPSQCRKEPARQYQYGNKVRLAQRTDSLLLLKALSIGSVFYDPGIKLENASSPRPVTKRRSQFRIASRSISAIYESVETVIV